MRGRIVFFLAVIVILSSACEDPNTLAVSRTFSENNLQTVYMDTFSVVTSTVQLDTSLTNGTGNVLVGRYRDEKLGFVTASSYFQMNYGFALLPDRTWRYDSMVLILRFNHDFTGDTTQSVNLNVSQIMEPFVVRTYPRVTEYKFSVYNSGGGFFNSSTMRTQPIMSSNVLMYPHRDSLKVRFPQEFGARWFRLMQSDSAHVFSDGSTFNGSYFYGLHLNVDPTDEASVIGFSASNVKIRMYYSKYYGDLLKGTHYDFALSNSSIQFNNIQYDRTGTELQSIGIYEAKPASDASHLSYVQSGTGLVTRLDLPSLKDFFAINISAGLTLNAAYLEVRPQPGSYNKDFLPPSQLQLFTTDNSNLPVSAVTGGTASIVYDYEYGIQTVYRYNLFGYVYTQIKGNTTVATPLILAPAAGQGTNVKRVYVCDRFYPDLYNKIKLKLFYTYVPTK